MGVESRTYVYERHGWNMVKIKLAMVSKDDLVWSMIDLTINKNKIEGLRRRTL